MIVTPEGERIPVGPRKAPGARGIAESEDRAGYRRLVRQLPRAAAIIRNGRSRGVRVGRIEVPAAHDAVP